MNQKYDTESFIVKSREVHGDFYDYSESVYTGFKSKIKIICPVHGPFEQAANAHMSGRSCPQCAAEKRRATMQSRYGGATPMQSDIIQAKMRDAKQAKYGSLKMPGGGRRRDSLDDFIAKAQQVHGDKYDYSQVEYINARTKVKIICPMHGVFEQAPYKHLQGSGCNHPECVNIARLAGRGLKPKSNQDVKDKPFRAPRVSNVSAIRSLILN